MSAAGRSAGSGEGGEVTVPQARGRGRGRQCPQPSQQPSPHGDPSWGGEELPERSCDSRKAPSSVQAQHQPLGASFRASPAPKRTQSHLWLPTPGWMLTLKTPLKHQVSQTPKQGDFPYVCLRTEVGREEQGCLVLLASAARTCTEPSSIPGEVAGL